MIFYNDLDRLAFFTRFCVTARRHSVRVYGLVLMDDHVHGSYVVDSMTILSVFVKEYTGPFAQDQNKYCGRKGILFRRHFGSAPKKGDKAARTNLIYLGNNPVERRLCQKAEDYRWNFLAYSHSDHPFSEKLVLRNASSALRDAIGEVKAMRCQDKPLSYRLLKRIFHKLGPMETEQLTDFIIGLYNVIDYESAIRFFDSYEEMLRAMHASTGSEYDLNEVFVGKSDAHYRRMEEIVMQKLNLADIHDILGWEDGKKYEVFQLLRRRTEATSGQIGKFLRMKIKQA